MSWKATSKTWPPPSALMSFLSQRNDDPGCKSKCTARVVLSEDAERVDADAKSDLAGEVQVKPAAKLEAKIVGRSVKAFVERTARARSGGRCPHGRANAAKKCMTKPD